MSDTRKIAIATGANNGIGFETTIGIVKAGYTVVMACRSQAKAEKAKADIQELIPSADLDIMLLDLSDFDNVRAFAKTFRERYDHLDLLINNAGILDYSKKRNKDGYDLQLATNHLGHFLLTSLLIDMMPDRPDSRIVALSSIAHKQGRIHFDDLHCQDAKDSGTAYAQSKLACLMFADELHRRLEAAGRKIRALTVHPAARIPACSMTCRACATTS